MELVRLALVRGMELLSLESSAEEGASMPLNSEFVPLRFFVMFEASIVVPVLS